MTKFEVFHGSLLKVETNAIVIPANRQLSLGWGSHIAEAVYKQGGKEIEREALNQFPKGINLGESIVTSAGRLPYNFIIHAAVLDKYDFNPLFLLRLWQRTNDKTLCQATRSALVATMANNITSIAFSPMGAGIGAMPIKKCARLMIDTAKSFIEETEGNIQKMVFAARKEKDTKVFAEILKDRGLI